MDGACAIIPSRGYDIPDFMPLRSVLVCGSALLCLGTGLIARRADGPPYSPAGSMATMQLEAGYRIELVAAEPDVQSPVAMDFDEHGRLFVVEMPGYPLDTRPTGRVKLLEDTDGDGRYETSRIFADGLVLPTGVMRWKKGVLVTAPPDLLYFEDTNGDGRADARTVVVTGFAFTNPQHMVNGPVYGLDNWIHLAHEGPAHAVIYQDVFGDRGTPLRWPAHPERPAVSVDRHGVRLRPDAGLLEATSGTSQYGHGFDAWGRYFTTENADHARHEVMPAAWLARNADLRLDSAMARIPDHGATAQVFPITKRPTFELLTGAGEFTSACAITPYTGGAFPEAEGTSLFVAEPVHNLVHRDVLAPAGATFVARRAEAGREFLAAGDAWFRPAFLSVGPDGALYVVDYYRPRIEHPEWTSSDLQKDPSPMYEGRDRGRIYRVARADAPTSPPGRPQLGAASDADLVRALESPNLWWRRTAQRLLVDRRPRQAIALLRTTATGSPSAVARVHALWTLEGLGALDDASIGAAMRDATPGVRENAVALAEPRLRSSPSLASRLVAMVDEADPRVRFVVLGALGSLATPGAAAARRTLLFAHLDDVWMQRAALSAGSAEAPALVDAMLRDRSRLLATPSDARAAFVRQLASIVGARQKPAEAARILDAVSTVHGADAAWWRAAMLEGLAQGAQGRRAARTALRGTRPLLLALLDDAAAGVRGGTLALLRIAGPGDDVAWRAAVERATTVASEDADPQRRADAIALVAMDRPESRADWLARFVSPHEPEVVQIAAVTALGRIEPNTLTQPGRPVDPASAALTSSDAIGRFLLSRWAGFTPEVRSRAGDVLIDDPPRARLLVDALSAGTVQPWSLGFWQKQDLVLHQDASIRAAARAVLEEDPQKRVETVRRYAAALDLAGDPAKGADVFARTCAACHRRGDGAGGDLGPDLATVRHRPPASLLVDILLPSRSIAQHYETYLVERKNGGTAAGLLGAQTASTIVLRQAGARELTIQRAEIATMAVVPQSTMPADLATLISPEEMADLLAFIRR
jgi:putative membrane-bound dehydrogenase-like protein